MQTYQTTFLTSQSGAVSVDWVVLSAALVGLGLATMAVVSSGVEDTANDVDTLLVGNSIIRTDFSDYMPDKVNLVYTSRPFRSEDCVDTPVPVVLVQKGDPPAAPPSPSFVTRTCTITQGSSYQGWEMTDGSTYQMTHSYNGGQPYVVETTYGGDEIVTGRTVEWETVWEDEDGNVVDGVPKDAS